MQIDAVHILPFVSAGVWTLAGLASIPRTRPRMPTESAFLLFTGLLGLWALLDGILFQTGDAGVAIGLVRARDAVASVGGLFLLCFAKWSTKGRAPTDLAFVVPVLGAIVLGWVGTDGIAIEAWGPRAIRSLPFFAAWFAQSFVYVMASFAYLARGLRALWRQDRRIALRGVSVVVATAVATVLAVSTNIAIGLMGSTAPPPFSSLLLIPGAALLAAALVAPIPRSRLVDALQRMVLAFDRDILGAAVLGEDGAVFGIALQKPMDEQVDDLPEAMVAVQQSLVSSPRRPPSRVLRVPSADVTFLVRSGSGMTLVVALRGPSHDFLEAAVEETFARVATGPGLWSSARRGSIPAMGSIQKVLRELVVSPA